MNVKRSGLLWELYPEFKRRKAFYVMPNEDAYKAWSPKDLSDLGKCVVAYSDPEGPLKDERDISNRLTAAVDHVGLKHDSLVGQEVLTIGRLFLSQTHSFYEMVHAVDYELWISAKMQLHNFLAVMRSQGDAKDLQGRRQLMKEVEDMVKDVQRIEARVFKDMTLLQKIVEHITGKDNLEGYAESYAVSISELVDNEYKDIFQ